jgi:hypothetical protein
MNHYNDWMTAIYTNRMMDDKRGRVIRGGNKPALQAIRATNTKPSRLSVARKRLADITLVALEYGAPKKK